MYGVSGKHSDPLHFLGADMIVGNAIWFESKIAAEKWLERMCSSLGLLREQYAVLQKPKGYH